MGVFKTTPAIPTSIEASLPSPEIRLSQINRKYALRAIQLAKTHPVQKAIARLNKTKELQKSKQPKTKIARQLETITSSIPTSQEREEIILYKFKP